MMLIRLLCVMSGKLPFDTFRDFAPVSLLVAIPQMLVVHPAVPANSVKELIALAKSTPGKLNYATSGPGSPNPSGDGTIHCGTGHLYQRRRRDPSSRGSMCIYR